MRFSRLDAQKNEYMLTGIFKNEGYDWWWHSFTGENAETGEERPFFIEFFVCNPALAEDKPVLGQLPENQAAGKKPSYLMVKAGTWGEDHCQLHRFFPWKDVTLHGKAPYSVKAGDCYASDNVLRGSISITEEEAAAHPEWMCDAGEMEWELILDKKIAFNVGYGTSHLLRFLKAFEMYWHAEGMKTEFSGTVTYNGVKYNIKPETSYGYSDKNWGKDFTSPWIWLSSNELTSNITGEKLKNSAFDIGGGKPKVFGISLDRILLGAFYYEGTCYEFNFSKVWTRTKTEFDAQETEDEIIWHVRQESSTAIMETDVRCFKKDMLLVNYEAPNGKKLHNRLWNGGNGTGDIKLYKKVKGGIELVDDIHATHIGCEFGEYGPAVTE